MKRTALPITLALMLLAAANVLGQGTNATLSGTVLDPSKAMVPGATVIVVNVNTGVSTTTVSNESGVFVFPSLQPGTYRVTAEMPGFKTLIYNDIKLEVSARVSLNLQLELGTQAQTIEVEATLETALGLVSASIGGMITSQMVRDLPLESRSVLDLTALQAGAQGDYINAARIGTINTTVDGVNVVDNRINQGIMSSINVSTDLIEEVRVVTSPADAEYSRGSAQIQMSTRSGTNQFHGSAWDQLRNTWLNANSWGNNRNGIDSKTGEQMSPRPVLIRNQFGGRLGGPIIKNKTFFFVLYEGTTIRTTSNTTATVFTDTARQGLYRFYPGAQNANANANNPTVDMSGNPVKPPNATGDLQTVSILGRDPNRMVMDPSGLMKQYFDYMPSPNYFRTGDGLNTAGFQWRRKEWDDTHQISFRIDHNFSEQQRLNVSYTFSREKSLGGFYSKAYPDSPPDDFLNQNGVLSLTLLSTIRPNLLNQFRVGILRPTYRFYQAWEVPGGMEKMPTVDGEPFLIVPAAMTSPLYTGNDPQGRITPVYQYGDTITWMKGAHAFIGGAELRFVSTNGFNSFSVMPRAALGAGGVSVQNISNIPGIGQNTSTANNILYDLTGSVSRFYQVFNSDGGVDPQYVPGATKYRNWKNREFTAFFKDDWKLSPNLTLNLGVRWEFYSVPYDPNGKTAAPAGGSGTMFGITGTGFKDMWKDPPNQTGQLIETALIGPNTNNPDRKLYNNDWNNFAPAVGVSWSIPYFGAKKTVLRMGYGWAYERVSFRLLDVVAGDNPGLNTLTTVQSGSYLDLTMASFPLPATGAPLSVIPVTARTQTWRAFDDNMRIPYAQNWNISLQRELMKNLSLEVRYVGSKGTKLLNSVQLNERNVFAKGTNGESIVEAFMTTQAGGSSPLLNQLYSGLSIPGLGVVNGTTITGSDAVRKNSTTANYLASNSVGSYANYLWTSTEYTGQVGGIPRRAGYPENWISTNPQVASSFLAMNCCNSNYHSLQVEVVKRYTSGFSFQGNYTFSKALGDEEGSGQQQDLTFRNLRDRSFQKRLLSFSRFQVVRLNSTYILPFGPGKSFLTTSNSIISRIVDNWTIGAIFIVQSGSPLNFSSGAAAFNTQTGTPMMASGAKFPKTTGEVYKDSKGDVYYFNGFTQIADPYIANLTTKNGVQNLASYKALVDPNGNIVLTNPLPGQLGSLGWYYITGPGNFGLDVNLVKRIRIDETRQFELRAVATDLLNTPQWGNPTVDINNTSFGRITSASGNRIITVELRINF